jgi:hypothetical protein
MGRFVQIENNSFNVVVSIVEQLVRQKICVTEGFDTLFVSSIHIPSASTDSPDIVGWIRSGPVGKGVLRVWCCSATCSGLNAWDAG